MLILSSLWFISNVFATTWSELNQGRSYKINRPLQLQQTERSKSFLDLSEGDQLKLKKVRTSKSNTVFVFDYLACPGQEMKTAPLEVADVSVGLAHGCELVVNVQKNALKTKSIVE